MASISSDKRGKRRILFVAPDEKRQTLYLGKTPLKVAQTIRVHVEALLASRITAQPVERQTALWLAEIGESLYAKLANLGLVDSRQKAPEVLTLGQLLDSYLEERRDIKPGTRFNLDLARRNLLGFFGEGKPITEVNEADAASFQQWLALTEGLAANTVRRRCGRARQFFAWAVRRRLLEKNPFAELSVATRGNPARQRYVPAETIREVLKQCPTAEWRLIVALCRWGGLRCPSEHLALRWGDVDFAGGKITVRSPKTEHLEGKASRTMPLFPELRPFLEAAREEQSPGAEWVIHRNRRGDGTARTVNWSTRFLAHVRRAGFKPWPRLFHALRSSCETDLMEHFPAHVVCAWLGNSLAVAKEHYLVVTDEHFRRAAAPGSEGNQSATRGTTQNGAEPAGTVVNGREGEKEEPAENAGKLGSAGCLEGGKMTPRGLDESLENKPIPLDPTTVNAFCNAFATLLRLLRQEPHLALLLTPEERAEAARLLSKENGREG